MIPPQYNFIRQNQDLQSKTPGKILINTAQSTRNTNIHYKKIKEMRTKSSQTNAETQKKEQINFRNRH